MKKIFLFFVFILAFLLVNAQPFKKMDEYKAYLLKNANTLDKIEGIWEISKRVDIGEKTIPLYLVAIIKMAPKSFKIFSVNETMGTIIEDTGSCSPYWFKSKHRKGHYEIINNSSCNFDDEDKAIINAEGLLQFSGKSETIENYATSKGNGESNAFEGKSNLVDALQGKLSGVQITNNGGQVGSGNAVVIRGYNSLIGNNQPLYIVDGVPIDNTLERGTSNQNGFSSANRAIDINPDNIASVTVLKGGAATALYGIHAANGAIVINTKLGNLNKDFSRSVSSWNHFSIQARKVF